jgi:HSF-type DNA-binding
MEILSNEDHADIISWLTNGRGFMIYNKKRFSVEVLPKYFKKSKFTSFTRKLNRWNFTRITRGPETGAYYHEFFERGNLRLCMQMCCQSSKNFPTSSTSGSGGIPGAPTMTGGNLMGMAHSNPSGFALSSPSALEGISGLNRTLGQSMNRLRLGESMERAAGGMMGNDPLRSLGLLQNQMQAQMAAAAVAAGYGTPNVNNNTGNDTLLQQLRQLEHQRDILMKQQQQQQQLQQIHQLQQLQQQQQQLALLGLQGVSGANLSGMPSPDLSLGTLQRSNTNSYLAMLMAQEKLQAQLGSLTTSASPSLLDFQRQQANILQAQQQQLEHYNQQRLLQAALQQHQQQQHHQLQHQQQLQLDASCNQNPSSLLLSQLLGGGANVGVSIPLAGDIIQGVNSSTSSDSSNPPDLDHRGKLNKRGGSAA